MIRVVEESKIIYKAKFQFSTEFEYLIKDTEFSDLKRDRFSDISNLETKAIKSLVKEVKSRVEKILDFIHSELYDYYVNDSEICFEFPMTNSESNAILYNKFQGCIGAEVKEEDKSLELTSVAIVTDVKVLRIK